MRSLPNLVDDIFILSTHHFIVTILNLSLLLCLIAIEVYLILQMFSKFVQPFMWYKCSIYSRIECTNLVHHILWLSARSSYKSSFLTKSLSQSHDHPAHLLQARNTKDVSLPANYQMLYVVTVLKLQRIYHVVLFSLK